MKNLNESFTGRLSICANNLGSKRALAEATGISEAQLFRYMKGEAEPSASKIIAIAKASQVDASWLLTGSGNSSSGKGLNLHYDPADMRKSYAIFENALKEIGEEISPSFKAQIFDIIYTDILMGQGHHEFEVEIGHLLTLFQTYFLMGIKMEELPSYIKFIHQDYLDPTKHDITKIEETSNHICRAGTEIFNTPAGQFYYDRMGHSIMHFAAKRMDKTIADCQQITRKTNLKLLDLGCGNGREISYLHRNYENIKVHGVDNSIQCINMCKQLLGSKGLPENSITKADLRFLPFEDNSFDVVYSRQTLSAFPYFPNKKLGLEQVFKEVHRILKHKGIFTFVTRYGHSREYAYFQQLLCAEDINKLACKYNFTIHKNCQNKYYAKCVDGIKNTLEPSKYDDWLDVIIQKN